MVEASEATATHRFEPSRWTRRLGLAGGLLLVTWAILLVVVAVQVWEVDRVLPRHPGFRALLDAFWACWWGWLAIGCWGARIAIPRKRVWWTLASVVAALLAALQMFLLVAHLAEWLGG